MILFFFNETATTVIYSYRHTLSLHNTLPIFDSIYIPVASSSGDVLDALSLLPRPVTSWESSSCIAGSGSGCWVAGKSGSIPSRNGCAGGGVPGPLGNWRSSRNNDGKRRSGACWPSRSEEHTSELQSLMRISYAVLCLKKKTQTHK